MLQNKKISFPYILKIALSVAVLSTCVIHGKKLLHNNFSDDYATY